ncbi:MAG: TatD family hydrolase [Pseudomonadales bacterium]
MIDIGVNLLHPQFDPDRTAVVDRARAAGVTGMLVTATDLTTAEAAIDLCARTDLYCTAGVHPHEAKDAPADLSERLLELAGNDRVRAIGETGLDFHRSFSPHEIQRRLFDVQLEVASTCGLPVFVHDRDTGGAVFDELRPRAARLAGVVVHCFTGTSEDLERYLDLGCFIGITGWVTEKRRGVELREVIRDLPLEKLLIETDAPFLLPHNVPGGWREANAPGTRRRRNEPALLPWVAAGVAEAMSVSVEDVIRHSGDNARRLFGLP